LESEQAALYGTGVKQLEGAFKLNNKCAAIANGLSEFLLLKGDTTKVRVHI
jgi:hypothetical protein